MIDLKGFRARFAGPFDRGAAGVVFALLLLPQSVAAQGQPVETGTQVPVALWVAGAAVLGVALAYGVMRNRSRTSSDKRDTEQGTKDLYREVERDNKNSGSH